MALDWDPAKARINFEKHGVRFSETEPVFRDDCAITIADDSDPGEQRLVSIGSGAKAMYLPLSTVIAPMIFGSSRRDWPLEMSAGNTRKSDEKRI